MKATKTWVKKWVEGEGMGRAISRLRNGAVKGRKTKQLAMTAGLEEGCILVFVFVF